MKGKIEVERNLFFFFLSRFFVHNCRDAPPFFFHPHFLRRRNTAGLSHPSVRIALLAMANTTTTENSITAAISGNPGLSLSTHEKEMECMICAERAQAIFCFSCGHYTCYICGLRMLRLQQPCPVCRKPSKNGVLTTTVSLLEGQYCEEEIAELRKTAVHNSKLQCFIDSPALASEMSKLYLPLCPLPECWDHGEQVPFNSEKGLKVHLQQDHSLYYCNVCLQRRPLFLAEQTLYTKSALQRHHNGLFERDPASFAGHPPCLFCGDRNLYLDAEDLMKHMLEHHFYCDFCNRDQFLFTFFSTRDAMYSHFRSAHKLCEHPKCSHLDTMLRVYRDEFELDVHRQREHNARPTAFKPGDFTTPPPTTSSLTGGGTTMAGSERSPGSHLLAGNTGVGRFPSSSGMQAGASSMAAGGTLHPSSTSGEVTHGVSSAADLAITRIVFDFLGQQRVLDMTPKKRSKGGESIAKGRGGRERRKPPADPHFFPGETMGEKEGAQGAFSSTAEPSSFFTRKMGLPSHFLPSSSTLLTTVMHRPITEEEATALDEEKATAEQEVFVVPHGHWGNEPRAIRPYVPSTRMEHSKAEKGESIATPSGEAGPQEDHQAAPQTAAMPGKRETKGVTKPTRWDLTIMEGMACERGQEPQVDAEGAGKKKHVPNGGDHTTSPSSAALDPRRAQDRLDALLELHLPTQRDFIRFQNDTRHYMQSTIKTSEYYDILGQLFSFDVLEEVVPLLITTCPIEEKRLALRELWKMKTSPEMVRYEKVRREEEETKKKQLTSPAQKPVTPPSATRAAGGAPTMTMAARLAEGGGGLSSSGVPPNAWGILAREKKKIENAQEEVGLCEGIWRPPPRGTGPRSLGVERNGMLSTTGGKQVPRASSATIGKIPMSRGTSGADGGLSYAAIAEKWKDEGKKEANASPAPGVSSTTSGSGALAIGREEHIRSLDPSTAPNTDTKPWRVLHAGVKPARRTTAPAAWSSWAAKLQSEHTRGQENDERGDERAILDRRRVETMPYGKEYGGMERKWKEERDGGGGHRAGQGRDGRGREADVYGGPPRRPTSPSHGEGGWEEEEEWEAYEGDGYGGKEEDSWRRIAMQEEEEASQASVALQKKKTTTANGKKNAPNADKETTYSTPTAADDATAPHYPSLWEGMEGINKKNSSMVAGSKKKKRGGEPKPNWSTVVMNATPGATIAPTTNAGAVFSIPGGGSGVAWIPSSSSSNRSALGVSTAPPVDVHSEELFPSLLSEEEQQALQRRHEKAEAMKKRKPQLNAWFEPSKNHK